MTRVMIEEGSDVFRTLFLSSKQKNARCLFFFLSSASVRCQVVCECTKLQVREGFTIYFCLSHEKLKEKSVHFIQVCMYSMIFFIWGENLLRQDKKISQNSSRLEEALSCLLFRLVSCFPFSSSVSVNLSLALLE